MGHITSYRLSLSTVVLNIRDQQETIPKKTHPRKQPSNNNLAVCLLVHHNQSQKYI